MSIARADAEGSRVYRYGEPTHATLSNCLLFTDSTTFSLQISYNRAMGVRDGQVRRAAVDEPRAFMADELPTTRHQALTGHR